MNDFLHFIQEEFVHVAPLFVLAGLGITIIFERFLALYQRYPLRNPDAFFRKIREFVIKDQINEALAVCDQYGDKLAPQIVKEGLMRAHQPEALIENGLEIAVAESSAKISQRTGFLSMIANVATLLGLFATILGLVQAFNSVKDPGLSPAMKSAKLNAGIATAMFGTMTGLGIAIPCIIAFSFLMARSNRISAELDQAAMKTMDFLKQRFYAGENSSSQNSQRNLRSVGGGRRSNFQ